MNVSVSFKSHFSLRPTVIASSIALALLAAQPALAMINTGANLAQQQVAKMQAEQIVAKTRSASSAINLGANENLVVRNYVTNEQGRTIVRADHTYQGHRVWGSTALIHAEKNGTPQLVAHNLSASPAPANSPSLSQSQATSIAMKAMSLKGVSATPKVELVVFPTSSNSGIKMVLDQRQHKYVIDRKNSVMTVLPTDPYVWAYEVQIFARNKLDGIKEMTYVVDARTGALLHVETGLRSLAVPNPPSNSFGDVATQGTGNSQYNGTVTLDTTTHADGTSSLIDASGRATSPNYYLSGGFQGNDGNYYYDNAIGLQTLAETHEGYGASFMSSNYWFDSNLTNVWGDGKQFVMFPYGNETTANGQTAAVDAQFGMATTWDFYKNVFVRNGIDGYSGQSPFSVVHATDSNTAMYYDNAFWSNYSYGMFYSDGTLNAGVDPSSGLATTPYANGFNSLTSIDITGHEMTHGVTANSSNFDYAGESGGMNEATSDIMGQMVEAYSKRPAGADSTIPLTGNDWMIGSQIAAKPLRYMYKPSLDGVSVDMWYSGMKYLDVHYSSGPLNRMFYFLSQGASSTVASNSYSPYLPGGMTGIGNDHAARIWYKALNEYLINTSQYADARVAALKAAYNLYGANSPEIVAVRSAFAAINVGNPSDESPARVRIYMPTVNPAGTALNPNGTNYFLHVPVVSMGTTVKLKADVQNALDTSVTWKAGGMTGAFNSPGYLHYGGVFGADGSWAPDNEVSFHSITVVSNADPLQFAEGIAWVINGDADADNEFDAIDLGSVALSWGLSSTIRDSHTLGVEDGFVDSINVSAIVQAFKNAFGGV